MKKNSNSIFKICKNHTGQNFKYKLEDSFWFIRVTETKQCGVQKFTEKDLLFSCMIYFYVFIVD
jgi:hypothetical protein